MSAHRDDLYYLETVVFLVENRLFKVLQHHFMQSEVFSTTFSLPSGNAAAEGSSDTNPFILHGIKANEFQAFLKVLSPLSSTMLSDMTCDEWISTIKLSTMWGFEEARTLSIQKLSKLSLSPVDKVILGKTYHVPAWLKEGYEALIVREEVMTAEELLGNAKKLGWDTMAKVLRVRDLRATSRCKPPPRCARPYCQGHVHGVQFYCQCCGRLTLAEMGTVSGVDVDKEIRQEFPEMSEVAAAT